MTESRRLRTQAERGPEAWRQVANTRPGYATYSTSEPGSPCWWARQGDSRPWRPAPWRTPWTGPDPMISGSVGPVPGDVMAALNEAQRQLADLPPPITCLRMHPAAHRLMAARAAALPPLADAAAHLLGIPVIEDTELPYGAWHLLDATGAVVKRGQFRMPLPEPEPTPPPVSFAEQLVERHGQPMRNELDRACRDYEAARQPRRRWWHRYTRRNP